MLHRLGRLLDLIERAGLVLAITILVAITFSICLEVVMRYLFNSPLIWVVELSEYGLLYITFLGTAWVLHKDQHVRVDIVYMHLPKPWRCRLGVLSSTVGFLICTVLVVYGTDVVLSSYARGSYRPTLLEVPSWMVQVIIPIGALLLATRFLRQGIAFARADEPRGSPE